MTYTIVIPETVDDPDDLGDLLRQIARMVDDGNTSGYHPRWTIDEVKPVAPRDIAHVRPVHVPVPVIPHAADEAQAVLYREAAAHLREGYRVGGSNLTSAVIALLDNTAAALEAPTAPAPSAATVNQHGEAVVERDGITVTITRHDDGEGDGYAYVIVDTTDHDGPLTIDLNDGPIWDGDPETDDLIEQAQRIVASRPHLFGQQPGDEAPTDTPSDIRAAAVVAARRAADKVQNVEPTAAASYATVAHHLAWTARMLAEDGAQ